MHSVGVLHEDTMQSTGAHVEPEHGVQAEDPAVEINPWAHGLHADAPGKATKVPAGHGMHCATLLCPALKKPGLHGLLEQQPQLRLHCFRTPGAGSAHTNCDTPPLAAEHPPAHEMVQDRVPAQKAEIEGAVDPYVNVAAVMRGKELLGQATAASVPSDPDARALCAWQSHPEPEKEEPNVQLLAPLAEKLHWGHGVGPLEAAGQNDPAGQRSAGSPAAAPGRQ